MAAVAIDQFGRDEVMRQPVVPDATHRVGPDAVQREAVAEPLHQPMLVGQGPDLQRDEGALTEAAGQGTALRGEPQLAARVEAQFGIGAVEGFLDDDLLPGQRRQRQPLDAGAGGVRQRARAREGRRARRRRQRQGDEMHGSVGLSRCWREQDLMRSRDRRGAEGGAPCGTGIRTGGGIAAKESEGSGQPSAISEG